MQVQKIFYLLALFPLAHAQDMYNSILANGCNEDGIIYNKLDDPNSHLSDGWGYNYVGYLCYDMAMGTQRYTVTDITNNTQRRFTGQQLHHGLNINIKQGETLQLIIQ